MASMAQGIVPSDGASACDAHEESDWATAAVSIEGLPCLLSSRWRFRQSSSLCPLLLQYVHIIVSRVGGWIEHERALALE